MWLCYDLCHGNTLTTSTYVPPSVSQITQESSYDDSESVYRSIFELRRRLFPQNFGVILDPGYYRSFS